MAVQTFTLAVGAAAHPVAARLDDGQAISQRLAAVEHLAQLVQLLACQFNQQLPHLRLHCLELPRVHGSSRSVQLTDGYDRG
jgi:hypothetical protein